MACDFSIPGVVICGSRGKPNKRKVIFCPTCDCRRWFLVHWAGVYYGTDITCLTCGDCWQDGMRGYRPFRRGWRKEAVARAKAQPTVLAAEWRRLVDEEITAYV